MNNDTTVQKSSARHGFTTVEVLITLFIGAMLIGGGYQMYGFVIRTSAEARLRTEASNITYEAVRQYSQQISGSSCSAQSITDNSLIPSESTLPNPRSLAIVVDCPFTNVAIARVTATLQYGSGDEQKEVAHALYAD